jgi:hypothetical protein
MRFADYVFCSECKCYDDCVMSGGGLLDGCFGYLKLDLKGVNYVETREQK